MNPREIDAMSWAMAEVYGAVTDRILINLARHFPYIKNGKIPGAFEYQARMLAQVGQVNRETAQIIMDSLGGADEVLRANLEKVILESLKAEDPQLRKAAEQGLLMGQGFVPPEMSPNQTRAFQAYYKQSADKLNLVNTVMLESTKNAYQATVADIVNRISVTQGILNTETGKVVSGVSSLNQAVRDGVRRMVDNGLTGFIDRGGHHWSPEAYVTMDVRTTMANTARAAVLERNEAYGNDLYQVSHHDGARPLCYPWQGKVISEQNISREVEDGEGNPVHVYAQSETSYGEAAGLFGINCGHFPIPFIPGFSRIRPPEQNKEENDKEYQESQQQRQLERDLRAEKRDLAVLKAQGASEDEINAQKIRVKNANAKLNDFCEETGRARRSSRVQTPINAQFPENNLYNSETMEMHRGLKRGHIEEPTSFTPAESVAEAEKFAETFVDRNAFGSPGISYQGVSVATANQVNKQLAGFINTYDVEKFSGVVAPARNTILGRTVKNANAAFNRVTRAMLLNRETLKTPETIAAQMVEEKKLVKAFLKDPSSVVVTDNRVLRILEASRKSGRATVPETLEDIINHELGHALQSRLKQAPNYSKIMLGWEKQATKISGYATEDIGEFIAESFSAWQKGERIWGELRKGFLSCLR